MLSLLPVWIGVIENPFVVRFGNIGVVTILCHHSGTDLLELFGKIFHQVKTCLFAFWACPGANVFGVAPDKMRRRSRGVQDISFGAIEVQRKHASRETASRLALVVAAPAVQHDHPLATGVDQQMIKIVPVLFERVSPIRNSGSIGK